MAFLREQPASSILRRGPARRIVACFAVVALAPILIQCDLYRPREKAPVPAEAPETTTPPKVAATPAPVPPLGRAEMIAAAARAASDYASGTVAQDTDPLVGRAFSVRTPFGCGPIAEAANPVAAPAGLARAEWGSERKTIQLSLDPDNWTGSALIAAPGVQPGWEAVEGFWLARPWLATEACPGVARDPLQAAASGVVAQTVGLAAVFQEGASRVARRNGRAYVFTVRPERDATILTPPADGYRVLIQGRVSAFPDGRAFRCRATSPDQRPTCVAAITLDRVAFTLADGTVLSEWRPG